MANRGRAYQAWSTITPVVIDTATDHTIIAAPSAGSRLRVRYVKFQNIGAVANTIIVKWGSTVIETQTLNADQSIVYELDWTGPAATALVANLSAADDVRVSGQYATEYV